MTAGDVVAMSGGQLVAGESAITPAGFSIDSRSIEAGQAFFAIVAARNGHAFVGDAVERGAAVVVVSEPVDPAVMGRATIVKVADTTQALQDVARVVRRRSGARVVAITGSAGKTTTKDAIAALLEARFSVVKNPGNLNNHLGLPLSLLELRHGADVGVMELGMNHAGEIRVLVGIAEPDVRVWTNVGDAHIGHFGSVEALADAKAEILEAAGPDTVFVGNADDARVMGHAASFPGRVVTFGFAERADVRAEAVKDEGLEGARMTVVARTGRAELQVPLHGRGNLANVLCATAVAAEMGVPMDEIAPRVAALRPGRRRGEVRRLGGQVTVVDDSYNSSPSALRQALETLARHEHGHRRVAVLGEMLELGDRAIALHEACGRAAAQAGLGLLVTVGGEPARRLGRAAIEAGLPATAVRHVGSSAEAAEAMAEAVAPGDVVLVKGSRGVKTDLVVDRLVAVCG